MSVTSAIWGQDPSFAETIDQGFFEDLLGVEAGPILDFLEKENLLQQVDIRNLAPSESFVHVLEGVKQWETNQIFQDFTTNTHLKLDYYQLRNDTFHNQQLPQQYLNVNLIQAIQIGKLPLSLNGNLIFRDGQFDTRLTNARVQLDHSRVIEQLKGKLHKDLKLGRLLSLPDNPLQLSPQAQAYLLNELKYRFYQQIITRADFYQLKSRLSQEADSLKQLQLNKAGLSQELDSLQQQLNYIHKIEDQYQQHWQRKKNFNQSVINELTEKSNNFGELLQQYRDPETMKEALLSKGKLSAMEKWMLWTKNLEIGLYHLRGSAFTVHNIALNGLHYATEGRHWFGEIAWGRQSFNTNFFPTFTTSLLDRFSGNRNLYASVGIGQEESNHIRLSFLNVREGSSSKDTLFIYPKANTVVSLSGMTKINEHWSSEMELAVSDHDLVGTNLSGDSWSSTSPKTSAAEISFNYRPSNGWISIGAGYFHVGSRFISLGNPFLLTNRQGIVSKIKSQLGKRLTLDLTGKFGQSIGDDELFEGQLSDIQVIGSLSWQIGEQNNIQAQFSPNTFKQSGAGTFNVSNYNTLISIQGVFQQQLGESTWSHMIGYTNYRSNFTYYETSSLDRSHYLFIQESLSLPGGYQISTVATLGGAKIWQGTIREVFTQSSLGYQAGKWNATLGLQILKDRFYPSWQYGLNTSIQINIGKSLQYGIDVMWQQGFENESASRRFLGHISVGWKF